MNKPREIWESGEWIGGRRLTRAFCSRGAQGWLSHVSPVWGVGCRVLGALVRVGGHARDNPKRCVWEPSRVSGEESEDWGLLTDGGGMCGNILWCVQG